jgi:hypothetical protein
MIVKNESHIIEKTLNNLCSKIVFDYWVICDTGSTDNTKEIIQDFFNEQKIQGELHTDEWVDFGHNRTLALEKAFNKTDYLLVFDADDKIEGDIVFPKNMFEYDSYMLRLSLNSIIYERQAIINNRKKWKYFGVLHEYIECLESANISRLEGNYYIMAGTVGNRSADTEKYKKDALILEKAYEIAFQKKDPIFNRYSFYCANSYKDANDINNAVKWYKNTLKLNNWCQEKYISCMRLYDLYDKQNKMEEGIYYLIESYKYDNTRVEGIYNLIKYYCIQNQDLVSYKFYELIQNYYENDYINDNFSKKLFVNERDYSFFLPYYMIIVCERLKKYDIGLKMFDIIFTKKTVDVGEWWIKNLVFNLQFFIEKNKDISFAFKWREYLSLINQKGYDIDKNLVNNYEVYNVSNFIEIYSKDKNDDKNDDKK